jgi:hypothetical protein
MSNNVRLRPTLSALLAGALLAACAAEPTVVPEPAELLAPSLAPDERLVATAVEELPELGLRVTVGVAADADQRTRAVTVLDDGTPVDLEALRAEEERLAFARRGRLTPAAAERLAVADAGELVTLWVAVATAIDDEATDPVVFDAEVDGEREGRVRARRSLVAREIARQRAPLVAWLEAQGATVRPLTYLPLVEVTAPASLFAGRELSARADVVLVDVGDADREPDELLGFAGNQAMNDSGMVGGVCGTARCEGPGLAVGIWEAVRDGLSGGQVHAGIATWNKHVSGDVTVMNAPKTCSAHNQCTTGWEATDRAAMLRCLYTKGSTCAGKPVGASGCTASTNLPRCIAEHPTIVAGHVGMFGPFTEEGTTYAKSGAPDARFYYANDDRIAGLDWLLGQSVTFINRSMTVGEVTATSALTLAMDYAARYDYALITLASGNDGGVAKCGRGWNTICVGGYAYGSPTTRTDDVIWSSSAWQNPVSGLERPHLVGPAAKSNGLSLGTGMWVPATSISSTATPSCSVNVSDWMRKSACGWNNGTDEPYKGTSFAAPSVLGFGIMAFEYEGAFSMLAKPLMNKVALMASARDANADGGVFSPGTDARDGAGAPDGVALARILANNAYKWFKVYASTTGTSCGTGCVEYTVATVSAPASAKTLRVAAGWQGCPNRSGGTNTLANNFDLVVTRSGSSCGGATAISASTVNEVEMVEMKCATNTASHSYTIKVRRQGALSLCGGESSEPVAVAWDLY